ncbi:MAG: hypothetical protein R3B57_05405 [Phycisphaerales bacterium]
MERMSARMARGVVAGGVVGLVAIAGGCMGYASYPNAEGSLTRSTTNSRAAAAVMRESLRWVTTHEKDMPGRFAVNLPPGTSDETYWEVATSVGGEALSTDNMDLPRYSVGRVWVRGGEAKVDVTRPVMALGRLADGGWVTQTITLELEGGLTPWRVVRDRPWALGAIEAPTANPVGVAAAPTPEIGGETAAAPEPSPGPATDQAAPEGARADAEPDVIQIEP